MATHPVADGGAKEEIRRRVRNVLTQRTVVLPGSQFLPENLEFRYVRTIAMVCAAYAANVLENALATLGHEARERAFAQVDELLAEYSQWPFGKRAGGASGGVGSAAIQLANRRGASVIAVSSKSKSDLVKEIGANTVVNREDKLTDSIENESIDVVIDLVAGKRWGDLLDVLKKGGRYAVAGAIAGPIVELDVRTLYLKDLVLIGCTFQDRKVFENLIGYIERNEIKPLVSKTYPLKNIVKAQKDFVSKKYGGKLVLLP